MIAVEPERFAQVAYWRDDLADEPLPELLAGDRRYRGSPAGDADRRIGCGVSVRLRTAPRSLYYR